MPSGVRLAGEHGVGRNVVRPATGRLIVDGLLEGRAGSGAALTARRGRVGDGAILSGSRHRGVPK
ncbi:hypothetical protein ACGFZL_18160 [Streptomyces sp. NPDC048182]|uniref:hypothetical protein n=1 Tax=Streptomyces sp. NPDC048182 TaxID=3365507 RepID=UPI00370FE015